MLSFEQFFTEDAGFKVLGKAMLSKGEGKSGHRIMIGVDLGGGKTLGFYQSSKGTSGKSAGAWYPFFGLGSQDDPGGFGNASSVDGIMDWVIKGGAARTEGNPELDRAYGGMSQMDSGYGQPVIRQAQDWLNANFPMGDPPGSLINTPITSGELKGRVKPLGDDDLSATQANEFLNDPHDLLVQIYGANPVPVNKDSGNVDNNGKPVRDPSRGPGGALVASPEYQAYKKSTWPPVHWWINQVLLKRGWTDPMYAKRNARDAGAAEAKPEPQPDSSQPGQGGALTLIGREGQMVMNLKTAVGKSILAKQFGPDSAYFSEPQFELDNVAGQWTVAHAETAKHATLLNGRALRRIPTKLKSGDELAVGNPETGVVKLPMTVQLR